MKRCTLLLGLLMLTSCDVATVALLMSGNDSSSSDDAPLPAAPSLGFGEPIFKAWIAQIPDPAAEQAALDLAKGNTSGPWTYVGSGLATAEFNPSEDPLSFNAILVQVSSDENFYLDSVEILDDQGRVVEHASGTAYSRLVTAPAELLGPPNGVSAVTNASGADLAYIFTIYAGPIDRFRINGHGTNQPVPPGDVIAIGGGGFQNPLDEDERPGGMAINGNGLVHLTLSVGDAGRLVRYDLAGNFVDEVEISTDLAAVGSGSHSVAIDSSGVIFTAASVQTGIVQVRRFESNLTPGSGSGFTSGFGNDRVEHNSIAVDNAGFVIVVGGLTSLISGRNHWRVKFPDTVDIINDPPVWQNSQQLDGNNPSINTYWHALTVGTNGDIFMTGELYSSLLITNQVYTAKFDLDGDPQWDDPFNQTGGTPPDLGHSIELDSIGNVYVGGTLGTTNGGKDGVLVCYTDNGDFVDSSGIVGAAGGDDEILDIAVDPADRSVYAVGYETVTGQGENIVIRKFNWNSQVNAFTLGWVRTHDGAAHGNDRAVSCALHDDNLVVAGYETDSGGLTKLVLRVYAK